MDLARIGDVPIGTLSCNSIRARDGEGWCFPRKVEKLLVQFTGARTVLHLFGGKAKFGVRLDIDPEVRPDVIGDAWIPPFARDSFDVVILDPPYVRVNAQEKTSLLIAAAWCARAHVVWFHTIWIHPPKGLKLEKAYLVRVGDGFYVRCLQIFRVQEEKFEPAKEWTRGPAIKYNRWFNGNHLLPFQDS